MTDLNNMRISDEELENVIGGKTTSLLSPCMFGVHERPMWDTIFAFSTEDHEYGMQNAPGVAKPFIQKKVLKSQKSIL